MFICTHNTYIYASAVFVFICTKQTSMLVLFVCLSAHTTQICLC